MITLAFDTVAWALALALCVPGLAGRVGRGALVVVALAILLHAPFAGTSLIAALRGAFASPAVSTVVVLAALFIARTTGLRFFPQEERTHLAVMFAFAGVMFYPPALGLDAIDPYAWGYGNVRLVLCVGGLALLFAASGAWVTVATLLIPMAAWRLDVLDSGNLWDYLFDPLLVLGCIVALVVGSLRSSRQPQLERSAAVNAE